MAEDQSAPMIPPDGDPHEPPPPAITQVTPVAGALAGGITATLNGRGFQPGAEVYFGVNPSPQVTYVSAFKVEAVVPAAAQTGSVNVTLVNLDGTEATKVGGYTYVTTEASLRAEVLGVTPLALLEDTETELVIRGRNLVDAYANGLVALRGPTRVAINRLGFTTSRDETTGIEDLVFSVRITATPPLGAHERVGIQVLASRRPGAASDGIFESSRHFFTVLPRAIPVTIAFTPELEANGPTLVVVAGRNLEGCTLDFGDGATVHMQKSDDRTLVGVVAPPDGAGYSESSPPLLAVRDPEGGEVAQYEMAVAAPGESAAASEASSSSSSSSSDSEYAEGNFALTLTPAPDQQMLAPTEEDSAVYDLRGAASAPFVFDSFNIVFDAFDWDFELLLVNEVRLIPFFDGGGEWRSPVLARVGKLFRVRGAGLLLALRIEIVIRIRVIIIIGFRFNIWDFGLFNEFSGLYPFAIGSLVISVRIFISLRLLISALVALVRPDGQLHIVFRQHLTIGIDFTIGLDGRGLHFDPDFIHRVRPVSGGVGPLTTNLLPCGGQLQLAEENGRTVFHAPNGSSQSFYFAHRPGRCCLQWNFNLELLRSPAGGGPEEILQQGFRTEFCIDTAPSRQMRVRVVSDKNPQGSPPPLNLDIAETDSLRALAEAVHADSGSPTGAEWVDVRDLGYGVEFYLKRPPQLLHRDELKQGTALAQFAGDNTIEARLFDVEVVVIDDETGEEVPSAFWPGGITGFDILDFVSRGLAPAVRTGGLDVIVNPLPGAVTLEPTLAYWVEPTTAGGTRTLREAEEVFDAQGRPATIQGSAVRGLERFEPFEQNPRQYVLAARVVAVQDVTSDQTITFRVAAARMGVFDGAFSLTGATPLEGAGYSSTVTPPGGGTPVLIERHNADGLPSFFNGSLVGATPQNTFTARINAATRAGDIVEIENLGVRPNAREEFVGTPPALVFVPPGVNVTGGHVVLSAELSAQSGGGVNVSLQNSTLHGAVTNDETYEEYLRVLFDAQRLLGGSGAIEQKYAKFADDFLKDLNARGHGDAVLNGNGVGLWEHAYKSVQGAGGQGTLLDDRQLYVARLQCIGALRAYCRRKGLTNADDLVALFELPSRGLTQATGLISLGTPMPRARKAIVTGFDPFGAVEARTSGNPSGLSALFFHGKRVGTATSGVDVKAAIFPVRYKEFDDGLIEKAVTNNIRLIVMLMTLSANRDFYDIERWAGRNRLDSFDNNRVRAPGPPIARFTGNQEQSNLVELFQGETEFLQTTLPYERVITSAQTLPGPQGDPATHQTPFVIDQSYRVVKTTEARATQKNGENRPQPGAGDRSGYEKVGDVPDQNKVADLGSGGNYLSNEIFYRTARARNDKRRTLKSGHFHIPAFLSVEPYNSPAERQQRERLISGMRTALQRIVRRLPRLRLTADLNFPQTPVNTSSGAVVLTASNETEEAITIHAVQVSPPFAFSQSAQLPITVAAGADVSLSFTFTPTASGVSEAEVHLLSSSPPPDAEPGAEETVWVDDALPEGAVAGGDGEGWNWVGPGPAPAPFSGAAAHHSALAAGLHQHTFFASPQTLDVGAGERLFAYVYLDPSNPPTEVMLQWNDDTWEHRAYWGANQIEWGTNNTESRRFMGPLPPAGQWVRLEVAASLVGLEGRSLSGMAFTLHGGRASWDRAGKRPADDPNEILLTAALTGEGVVVAVQPRVNVALASNGATATASSQYSANFPASAVNDGDRKGATWGSGGGWNDATTNAYPDWVQIDFQGSKTIDEIDVFTLQDNFQTGAEPTENTTFTLYGITAFDVQYWNGSAWVNVPGGSVAGNNRVWRKFTFAPVTTTKIRVLVNNALDNHSRIVEIEAYGVPAQSRVNVALAANGGTVTASSTYNSNFPASAVINGDRKGQNWGSGGGWNDATTNAYPDWLEVAFAGQRTIDEINVFTLQDDVQNPAEPTEALTFTQYGIQDFDVEYWTGSAWAVVPGGSVTNNNKVWRKFTFAPLTTTKIRVLVKRALDNHSRVVELEAYEVPRVNVALAANGGSVVASSTHSSNFPAGAVINGDRRGSGWGSGSGGWNDATADAFPDWLEVSFAGQRTIDEINVFTLQDDVANPSEPTEQMTFSLYGITAFDVQYWNGSAWVNVPGGGVTGNNKVWRRFVFTPVTTTKVRVVVTGALASHSRVVELEAYEVPRTNVALAANGGTVTASSTHSPAFPASAVINGDRRGRNWAAGGGWNDATADAYPDWLEVAFAGQRTIDEVSVFTLQDNIADPAEPTEQLTFTQYGIQDFDVEYWTGSAWAVVPGGSVTGNNKVWRKFNFAPLTTTKIRVVVNKALDNHSRVVEIEVWGRPA